MGLMRRLWRRGHHAAAGHPGRQNIALALSRFNFSNVLGIISQGVCRQLVRDYQNVFQAFPSDDLSSRQLQYRFVCLLFLLANKSSSG